MNNSIEISGELIIPGTKVNVKWLDNWYEGKVLEVEHQDDLYKIKDSNTGIVIVLDKTQFKVIDTSRPSHYQFNPGTRVAFYDTTLSTWISGVIEESGIKPALLVKWKKDEESNATSINWFEIDNVAPIISNEAFGVDGPNYTETQTKIQSDKHKHTTLEDILNERPMYHKNTLFQNPEQKPFENKLPSYKKFLEELDSPYRVKAHRTSVSMKKYYSSNFDSNISSHNNGKLDRYLQHQAALLHGKIDHSLLPPVWSYINHPKGIPHHPSSKFFRHATRFPGKQYGGIRMKRTTSDQFSGHLSKSPTMGSEPISEPTPYAQLIFPVGQKLNDISTRPLPPLPDDSHYEVPLSLSSPASWANAQQKSQPNPYSTGLTTHVEFEEYDAIAPTITSTSKSEMVMSAGGTVTLFCKATSETPFTIEWTKNGKRLTHNDDRVAFPAQDKLQLYGLCMTDAGTYQCRVKNAGGTAIYTCKLEVEEDTVKRSFSREYGLDALAKELSKDEFDLDNTSLTVSSEEQFDTKNYEEFPLNMARHPPSLTSMTDSLDQNLKVVSQNVSERKKPTKVSSATKIEDRKTNKEKRKRISNLLMNEVDDYLEGYGEDYGKMTDDMLLTLGKDNEKKQKSNKSKNKKKSKTKKKTKDKEQKNEYLLDDLNISEFEASLLQDKSHIQGSNEIIAVEENSLSEFELSTPKHQLPIINIEDELVLEFEEGMVREAGEGEESVAKDKISVKTESITNVTSDDEDIISQKKIATSKDSIDAHISFESEDDYEIEVDKEREDGEGQEQSVTRKTNRESGNVDLPLERQHYTESVRRLQESSKEYEQERFGKDKKSGRGGVFSKLFKSSDKHNKNLTLI